MKKKKVLGILLICLLIIILLSIKFISCSSYDKKLGFQPPIKGINWGMTSDEVIKKLNLSKDNIVHNDGKSIGLIYENISVFNQKANVEMRFDLESEIGLCNMYFAFENLNQKDLVAQLTKTYGKNAVVTDTLVDSEWDSKKISDLPQKIQDRFKHIKLEILPKLEGDSASVLPLRWSDIEKQPLTIVRLNDNKVLEYKASNMATYIAFNNDDTYNKIEKKVNDMIKNKEANKK